MSRLFVSLFRFSNLHLSELTMAKRLVIFIAFLLSLAAPAYAAAPTDFYKEVWSPLFVTSSATQFVAGATHRESGEQVYSASLADAASQICAQHTACEFQFGDCEIVFGGSSSADEHYNEHDTPLEGGLTAIRIGTLQSAVSNSCSDSGRDWKVGTIRPHLKEQYRFAWAAIQPKVSGSALAAVQAAAKHHGPVDWSWAKGYVVDQTTLCPAQIRLWVDADGTSHHSVTGNQCSCGTNDVSTADGFQFYSRSGVIGSIKSFDSIGSELDTINWNSVRGWLEGPLRANGVEYINSNGSEDSAMTFGRGASITEGEDYLTIDLPNACEELQADQQAVAEQEVRQNWIDSFGPVNFFAAAQFLPGNAWMPKNTQFTQVGQGFDGAALGEFGVLLGNYRQSLLVAGDVGVAFPPNALTPVTLAGGVKVGGVFGRAGFASMQVDAAWLHTSYEFESNMSTDVDQFKIEGGPRINFQRGDRGLSLGILPWACYERLVSVTYWVPESTVDNGDGTSTVTDGYWNRLLGERAVAGINADLRWTF